MIPIRFRSLLLPLFAAVLVLVSTSRVFGYINHASPDSVTVSTAVGTSVYGYILIYDGLDSNMKLPLGTIHLALSGSSQFSLSTDSVQQYLGDVTIRVRYSPTSGSPSFATLQIVGDSNTVYVQLVGNPITHFPVGLLTSNGYDSLEANKQLCYAFEADNKNADTIFVTHVYLTDDPRPGTQWSLENLPSLPLVVPPGTTTLGELCALVSNSDSDANPIYGSLEIVYTYPSGTDSTIVTIRGERQMLNSNCIAVSNTDFGQVSAGSSVTHSITLTNVTDSTIYLDSTGIAGTDYTQFTINSPTFPITIAAKSSVDVSITFSVPSQSTKDDYSGAFESLIYGNSPDGIPCSSLYAPLNGSVLIPLEDTITLDIPPDTASLTITAHVTESRHAIIIHNSGTDNLLLEYLQISQSDSVAFFGTQDNETADLYDSLAAGATSRQVIMTLETPDTGTYDLSLTLTYETQGTHRKTVITGNQTPLVYSVIAHRLPPITEGVSESLPQVAGFALNPNPASGEVTISLPQDGNSTIEIYDILGNLMLRKQAASQYIWSGETPGGVAAAGAYIVRVTERETNGTMAVSSKRLIFQR